MKIQLVSFVVKGLSFSMNLLGFMSKAMKVSLTELVSILPFGRSIRKTLWAIYSCTDLVHTISFVLYGKLGL